MHAQKQDKKICCRTNDFILQGSTQCWPAHSSERWQQEVPVRRCRRFMEQARDEVGLRETDDADQLMVGLKIRRAQQKIVINVDPYCRINNLLVRR